MEILLCACMGKRALPSLDEVVTTRLMKQPKSHNPADFFTTHITSLGIGCPKPHINVVASIEVVKSGRRARSGAFRGVSASKIGFFASRHPKRYEQGCLSTTDVSHGSVYVPRMSSIFRRTRVRGIVCLPRRTGQAKVHFDRKRRFLGADSQKQASKHISSQLRSQFCLFCGP